MALATLLLMLLFFPYFSTSIPTTVSLDQSLIIQACAGLENPNSCLSEIRTEIGKPIPGRNPNLILSAALKAAMKQTNLALEVVTNFDSTTTLNETNLAIEARKNFNTLSISYREQLAIEDCKELLDFSVTELAWSIVEMKKIRDGNLDSNSKGNLKAWLSAALSNQDTCLEGFEGTDRKVHNFIEGSLKQVTQLINNVLSIYTQFHRLPFKTPRNKTIADHNTPKSSAFPEWITDGDQELVKANPHGMRMDAVVALDGTGDYRTITEAINDAPSHSNRRFIIYVKKGVYAENIDLKKKKTNIMLVGDGIGHSVVTGNRNFLQGWTTFRTATVAVSGKGFIAKDMTFRNTAGPQNHQAVALRVDSDQSAFYRCSMEGYQDTLYSHSLRQFFRECNIYGTIDFIFGNGAAVLQNCNIFTRIPLPLQKVTITAQGRKSPNQSTGFVIQDSSVFATQPTYLGRPWKQYSRTVFMNTYMTRLVQPRGWLEWYLDFGLSTLWYGEYKSYGPGGSVSGRVRWPGFHIIKDAGTADFFTVGRFIDGRSWLPATGVKFTAGLSN